MLNTLKEDKALKIDDILKYYKTCFKEKTNLKIGLEYERISMKLEQEKYAPYEDLVKIIENYAYINSWHILKDEGKTIGVTDLKSSISFEPGGQLEISLEPMACIDEIKTALFKMIDMLNNIAKVWGISFLPYGISPFQTYNDIEIIPKNRYKIMNSYFKTNGGKFAPVMMRETAGMQVNIDYTSEADAFLKLKTAYFMQPFLTGLFANSPIRGGKLTNYKSFRSLAWLFVDNKRCGNFYESVSTFEEYIKATLKVPMLFIERGGRKILINGKIDFLGFMKYGFEGFYPDINDYMLHSSLTFPDIRLKHCIEIRNHDSQKPELALSLCAFYKAILYNSKAIEKVLEILDYKEQEIKSAPFMAAKYGLSWNIGGRSAFKITEQLFETALDSLDYKERKYLEKPLEILKQRKCTADFILDKNIKNSSDLIKYINKN